MSLVLCEGVFAYPSEHILCTHMCCGSQRLMSDGLFDCFSLYWGKSIDFGFTDFGRLHSHLALGIPSLETVITGGLPSLLILFEFWT